VARQQPTAFQRVFPIRDYLRGSARAAVLWSAAGSILLCLLLFTLYLIGDLLTTGGVLRVQTGLGDQVYERLGERPNTTDRGLLPAVWWGRDKVWGPALIAAWKGIPWLQTNIAALVMLILTAAVIWLLRRVSLARALRAATRSGFEVASRTRLSLHRQTLRLGPGDIEGRDQEHVYELFTTDVDRLRDAVLRSIQVFGRSPLKLVLLVVLAFIIHPLLAIQCIIPLAACWYVAQREERRVTVLKQRAQSQAEAELRLLAESLRKTRLVRGYGMEDYARDHFEKHVQRYQQIAAGSIRGSRFPTWSSTVLVLGSAVIVFYLIGAKVLITPQDLSFAAALLFVAALMAMYDPLRELWSIQGEREEATQAANRIQRYLNRIPDVGQAVGAKFLQPLSKTITFENVVYAGADKRPLLNQLSLKVSAGQQVCIVSTDPSEALALAYLLPRFIEPQAGRVLIDDEDIAWVTLESLRAEALYVGGNDPFFTGTVRENISGGESQHTLNEVTESAKVTHAHNFILKLPQGYETVIGEHGEQLDVGQSFRLSLARALLRNPALMIVEEPAQNLDEDTKSLLDDAYQRIVQNRTILYLPARMTTLRRADQIVFLHQGKVEAVGTHAQLVASSSLYRHWEYMRFNEFRHEVDLQPTT
jgi:ABC-type multidrug transport system fused ATPase/permease subunit